MVLPAGAAGAAVFGRGNERTSASWQRVRQWKDHDEAAGMSIAAPRVIRKGVAGVLRLETRAGVVFESASFVMDEVEGALFEHFGFPTSENYRGQGEELVIVDRGTLGGDVMGLVSDLSLMGDVSDVSTMGAISEVI